MKKTLLTILLCNLMVAAFAQNTLKISTNTHVVQDANSVLVLKNTHLQHDGTLTGGTVRMTGDVETHIAGDNIPYFENLTIDKTAEDVSLSQDIDISNTLDLQSGSLQLDDNELVIQPNATINAAANDYVKTTGTGAVFREVGSTAVDFPVGNDTYTPLMMSNDGTTGYIGVRSSRGVLTNGDSGEAITSDVVDITWHLTNLNGEAKDLSVTTTWNATEELASFDRDNAFIWHYTNNEWQGDVPTAATGSDPYSMTRSGITDLTQITVSSSVVLPIKLLSLVALPDGKNVQLNWTTATEINSDYFDVQHSMDGQKFETIGKVEAAGNSQHPLDYTLLHKQPVEGRNYYRLQQFDRDGSFVYSNIVSVDFKAASNLVDIAIYPNPTSDWVHIDLPVDSEAFRLDLFDNQGRWLRTVEEITDISLQDYTAGIYYLRLVDIESGAIRIEPVVLQK